MVGVAWSKTPPLRICLIFKKLNYKRFMLNTSTTLETKAKLTTSARRHKNTSYWHFNPVIRTQPLSRHTNFKSCFCKTDKTSSQRSEIIHILMHSAVECHIAAFIICHIASSNFYWNSEQQGTSSVQQYQQYLRNWNTSYRHNIVIERNC